MKYNSQARENQDRFILSVLDSKRDGTYVEVGGYLPVDWSNTFLLELQFGWRGVSLEYYNNFSSQWNGVRNNPCITCDATKVDYNELFEEHSLPKVIDFLQLDIDPASSTFEVLKRIDFDSYSFRVVTFEHDVYSEPDNVKIREESRNILMDNGYTLLIPDVRHGDLKFEDWYINEKHMPSNTWKRFIGIDPVLNTEDMKESTKNLFEELL